MSSRNKLSETPLYVLILIIGIIGKAGIDKMIHKDTEPDKDLKIEWVSPYEVSISKTRIDGYSFSNRPYQIREVPEELVGLDRLLFPGGIYNSYKLIASDPIRIYAVFNYNSDWYFPNGSYPEDYGWSLYKKKAYAGLSNPGKADIWFKDFLNGEIKLDLPKWWLCLGIKKLDLDNTKLVSSIKLNVQRRDKAGELFTEELILDPRQVGIVIVDVWNSHGVEVAEKRLGSIIPRINDINRAARAMGIQVIHCPSYYTPYSDNSPQREPVINALNVPVPEPYGNNFYVPYVSPPYGWNNMIPSDVTRPIWSPAPSGVNRNLEITDVDVMIYGPDPRANTSGWGGGAMQEMYNFIQAKGITHLIFGGVHANMCVYYKGFAAVQMKRLGITCLMANDLMDAITRNEGTLSPDKCLREVYVQHEKDFDGSFNANQLLSLLKDPLRDYTTTVAADPGLVSYWRMDGKNGNYHVQDITRNQGAWNAEHVQLGVAGIDYDTAAKFDGTAAIIVAPFFREDIPSDNFFCSTSSGNFTVEAWVQLNGGLGNNQWILSHDDAENEPDEDANVDFLLGLTAERRFAFVTRNMDNIIESPTIVTQEAIERNQWFYVVGVQNMDTNSLCIYVNGQLEASKTITGIAPNLVTSLQIGSRGKTNVADGEDGEDNNGEVLSSGFEFFNGVIDEVAIYYTALAPLTIFKHYILKPAFPR